MTTSTTEGEPAGSPELPDPASAPVTAAPGRGRRGDALHMAEDEFPRFRWVIIGVGVDF